jgi:Putative DNA-binding domain
MNDPKDWKLDDLKELIATQAEETSTLEFKHGKVLEDLNNRLSAEDRKEEISKDVSAFANRSGGVILYGMEEEKREPHAATALAPIDPAKCSKERLEQIIMSRLKPPIQNIAILPIKVDTRRYAYVVIIPGSHTAHQASDGRYYRRGNFGNQRMEDDEIRQVMNRPVRPTYRVELRAADRGDQGQLPIVGNVQNTSVMIGNDVSAVLLLPNEVARNRKELDRHTLAGTEVIDGNEFVIILDDMRDKVTSQLKPFERKDIRFPKACKVSDEPPSWTVPLLVRVYDQLGQAHAAAFKMSLRPDSFGKIVRERQ